MKKFILSILIIILCLSSFINAMDKNNCILEDDNYSINDAVINPIIINVLRFFAGYAIEKIVFDPIVDPILERKLKSAEIELGRLTLQSVPNVTKQELDIYKFETTELLNRFHFVINNYKSDQEKLKIEIMEILLEKAEKLSTIENQTLHLNEDISDIFDDLEIINGRLNEIDEELRIQKNWNAQQDKKNEYQDERIEYQDEKNKIQDKIIEKHDSILNPQKTSVTSVSLKLGIEFIKEQTIFSETMYQNLESPYSMGMFPQFFISIPITYRRYFGFEPKFGYFNTRLKFPPPDESMKIIDYQFFNTSGALNFYIPLGKSDFSMVLGGGYQYTYILIYPYDLSDAEFVREIYNQREIKNYFPFLKGGLKYFNKKVGLELEYISDLDSYNTFSLGISFKGKN